MCCGAFRRRPLVTMGAAGSHTADTVDEVCACIKEQGEYTTIEFVKDVASRFHHHWTEKMDFWAFNVGTKTKQIPVFKACAKVRKIWEEKQKEHKQRKLKQETCTNIFRRALAAPGVEFLCALPVEWRKAILPKEDPEGQVRGRTLLSL